MILGSPPSADVQRYQVCPECGFSIAIRSVIPGAFGTGRLRHFAWWCRRWPDEHSGMWRDAE